MAYKLQQLTTTSKECWKNFFCNLNVFIIVSHEPGWSSVKCVCDHRGEHTHSLTHSPGLFGRVGLLLFVVNTLPCFKNFQKLCLRDIKTQGMGRHTLFFCFQKISQFFMVVHSVWLFPRSSNLWFKMPVKPYLWSSPTPPPLFHGCLSPHVPSFAVLLSIQELLF